MRNNFASDLSLSPFQDGDLLKDPMTPKNTKMFSKKNGVWFSLPAIGFCSTCVFPHHTLCLSKSSKGTSASNVKAEAEAASETSSVRPSALPPALLDLDTQMDAPWNACIYLHFALKFMVNLGILNIPYMVRNGIYYLQEWSINVAGFAEMAMYFWAMTWVCSVVNHSTMSSWFTRTIALDFFCFGIRGMDREASCTSKKPGNSKKIKTPSPKTTSFGLKRFRISQNCGKLTCLTTNQTVIKPMSFVQKMPKKW